MSGTITDYTLGNYGLSSQTTEPSGLQKDGWRINVRSTRPSNTPVEWPNDPKPQMLSIHLDGLPPPPMTIPASWPLEDLLITGQYWDTDPMWAHCFPLSEHESFPRLKTAAVTGLAVPQHFLDALAASPELERVKINPTNRNPKISKTQPRLPPAERIPAPVNAANIRTWAFGQPTIKHVTDWEAPQLDCLILNYANLTGIPRLMTTSNPLGVEKTEFVVNQIAHENTLPLAGWLLAGSGWLNLSGNPLTELPALPQHANICLHVPEGIFKAECKCKITEAADMKDDLTRYLSIKADYRHTTGESPLTQPWEIRNKLANSTNGNLTVILDDTPLLRNRDFRAFPGRHRTFNTKRNADPLSWWWHESLQPQSDTTGASQNR